MLVKLTKSFWKLTVSSFEVYNFEKLIVRASFWNGMSNGVVSPNVLYFANGRFSPQICYTFRDWNLKEEEIHRSFLSLDRIYESEEKKSEVLF